MGIHLKSRKFIDSLGDWGSLQDKHEEEQHEKIAIDAMGGVNALRLWSKVLTVPERPSDIGHGDEARLVSH